MLRVAIVTIGVIASLCLTTQAQTLQPDATNAPGGIIVTKYGATAADFPGYDTVELCNDACRDWKRSYFNFTGFDEECWDAGPTSLEDTLGTFIYLSCPLGTDCSACGPRTVVVFDTIQEAVGNFTNEDGVFDGSLYVESTSLTSLDGMQPVKRIAGTLALRYNAQLEDITSLRSLESVDVLLLIQQNLLPGTLFGLESLRDVGLKLDFYNNTLLETIENFDSLEYPEGGVYISGHPMLTSITMDNLRSIGSIFQTRQYSHQLFIYENPMLQAASFPSLQLIEYDLDVNRNDELSYLNTDNLVRCGSYSLYFNGGRAEVIGPRTLETVAGFLAIERNAKITSISGFDSLREVTKDSVLSLETNDALESVSGFDNLQTVSGPFLSIFDNKVLTNITGFSSLTTLPGDLILNNTALTDFSAFSKLEFVGGCCELDPAWLLSSLSACNGKLCE